MKKFLKSIVTISAMGVLIFGASQAFFSDTETSEGNSFTAGSIDLSLGSRFESENNGSGSFEVISNNNGRILYTFEDIKPGDFGQGVYDLEVNANEAYLCAQSIMDSTPENGILDSETDAGDVTGGPDGGELQDYLQFAIFHDVDGNGVWDSGEPLNVNQYNGGDGNGFTAQEVADAGWIAAADPSAPDTWLAPLASIEPGMTYSAGFMYCFGNFDEDANCSGEEVDANDAQTDRIVGGIEFYAEQVRNNPDFACADLNPESVGAALGDYTAPTTCDVTVTSGQSIQSDGVDAATSGETLCVEDGVYSETVVIDKPLTLASENGPTNTATITDGVNIKASDVTLTGFIINPGSILGETVSVYLDSGISDVSVTYNDIDGQSTAASRGVVAVTNGVYTDVMVMHNLLHDLTTGIYTNPGSAGLEIMYNDFYDNAAGIGGFTGAHVAYNEFTSAGEAIGADGSYDNSVVEFNNFLTGTMLNNYSGAVTIDAPNNWWADGAGAQTTGNVDTSPEATAQYPHN